MTEHYATTWLHLLYNLFKGGRLSITLLLHLYYNLRGEDWALCYCYTYTTRKGGGGEDCALHYCYTYTTICLSGEDWALHYCYTDTTLCLKYDQHMEMFVSADHYLHSQCKGATSQ